MQHDYQSVHRRFVLVEYKDRGFEPRLEHMSLFAYILVCMQTFVMEHFKIQEFYRICCTQYFSTR